jgi:hypothetical protein
VDVLRQEFQEKWKKYFEVRTKAVAQIGSELQSGRLSLIKPSLGDSGAPGDEPTQQPGSYTLLEVLSSS